MEIGVVLRESVEIVPDTLSTPTSTGAKLSMSAPDVAEDTIRDPHMSLPD